MMWKSYADFLRSQARQLEKWADLIEQSSQIEPEPEHEPATVRAARNWGIGGSYE